MRIDKQRGRWCVRYTSNGMIRGRRFSSLSKAHKYARRMGGAVEHFKARNWKTDEHSIVRARWAHAANSALVNGLVWRVARMLTTDNAWAVPY